MLNDTNLGVNLGKWLDGKFWDNNNINRMCRVGYLFKDAFGYLAYTSIKDNGDRVTHPDSSYSGYNHNHGWTFDYVERNTDNDGRANAFRTNANGNGLTSYYWGGGDCDTGNISISENIHTVTVKSNGSTLSMYLDGDGDFNDDGNIDTYSKTPNTTGTTVTIGATNERLQTDLLRDDKKNIAIDFKFDYTELLTGEIYSVRIYNTALTDQQIIWNHITDKVRFGF